MHDLFHIYIPKLLLIIWGFGIGHRFCDSWKTGMTLKLCGRSHMERQDPQCAVQRAFSCSFCRLRCTRTWDRHVGQIFSRSRNWLLSSCRSQLMKIWSHFAVWAQLLSEVRFYRLLHSSLSHLPPSFSSHQSLSCLDSDLKIPLYIAAQQLSSIRMWSRNLQFNWP